MVSFGHKVAVPRRAQHIVSRPQLTEQLFDILQRQLITLTAPAGYGKTSLLIDFVSTQPPIPVCWYTLDSFDQDPWVFLEYLVAAVEQVFPHALERTTSALEGRSEPALAAVVASLARDLYAIGTDFVLVLDDWHMVDMVPEIGKAVSHLLSHCPNCRLMLSSRSYPSLPNLMLLLARKQMMGLDEQHLRFSASEAAAVLNEEFHAGISVAQASGLVERCNGWITGVLLLQQGSALDNAIAMMDEQEAERQVYQFLVEQVFDQQPPPMQTFLLDSALLPELTAERCDRLFERNDSRVLLGMLRRHHMFITESKPGVFHYHAMFKEFLLEHSRTLDPRRYRETATKITAEYLKEGSFSLAFDLCILANDLDAAQRVALAGGEQLYVSGRLETLSRWFQLLPLEGLTAPLLCLQARLLLALNQRHKAEPLVKLAAVRAAPAERSAVTLLQAQLAQVTGRYHEASALARQVLDAGTQPQEQSAALRILALCYHRLGKTAEAIVELQQAYRLESQRGDLYAMAQLQHDLGICHEAVGELRQAEECYSSADAGWTTIGNAGMRSMSLNSKGVAQHLAGAYLAAHATFTLALEHAVSASAARYQATILVSLGDLYSDLQCWKQAAAAYEEAQRIGGSAFLKHYLALASIRLLIRQGMDETAGYALDQLPPETGDAEPVMWLELRARVAGGKGLYDEALSLLDQALAHLGPTPSVALAQTTLLKAAMSACRAPGSGPALKALLDQTVAIADRLGHDAFLIVELFHLRSLLQHAQAAGWRRAKHWQERVQELQSITQQLGGSQQRPLLQIRTLGVDQIVFNDQPVEIGWLKAREILYYLLANPDGATADILCESFWPDSGAERARESLRTAIYRLRSALPKELVTLYRRQVYSIDRSVVQLEYDVERFLAVVNAEQPDLKALREALDLYQGPYLPWSSSNWNINLRSYLETRYLHGLHRAAELLLAQQAYQDALTFYQQILSINKLDELAHAGVMSSYMGLGNRGAAIEQYKLLYQVLDEELGLEIEQTSRAEQLYRLILAEA